MHSDHVKQLTNRLFSNDLSLCTQLLQRILRCGCITRIINCCCHWLVPIIHNDVFLHAFTTLLLRQHHHRIVENQAQNATLSPPSSCPNIITGSLKTRH